MKLRCSASASFAIHSRGIHAVDGRKLSVALVLVALLLPPKISMAQASVDAAKTAAREHFDRGLRLFNQLDNEGALLEFRRAYEIVPHAQVLKNIGLVFAAMGRPVQAVEAFDRLLASPTGLDPESLPRIRDERAHQMALVGELDVTTNATNAIVEVDGIEAGRAPLMHPLRLAKGMHVVSVVASGYVPLRRQIDLGGSAPTKAHFELVASDVALAHLVVRSRIPSVELYLDGESVGRTPLAASLTIAPGAHRFQARRPGYREVNRELQLDAGAQGTLDINPEVDPQSLANDGGYLALAISEPGAIVFINGESRGAYTTPLKLAAGDHTLRVQHAEFFPVERSIALSPRATTQIAIELMPTPDTLERYQTATRRRSTWGWVSTTTGGILTAASVGFLFYNHGQKTDKKAAFDAQVGRAAPSGDCDPKGIQAATCRTELQLALDNLEQARGRDVYGWVGLGVGGATLGLGLFLLLGNDDPDRYSPKPQSNVFALRRMNAVPWFSRDAAGATLLGAF